MMKSSISPRIARVTGKLTASFQPELLEVIDESETHRGHSGWREGGETHIAITIAAPAFDHASRTAAHRLIYEALQNEWQEDAGQFALHAVRITVKKTESHDGNPSGQSRRATSPSS